MLHFTRSLAILVLSSTLFSCSSATRLPAQVGGVDPDNDPYLWLEDVQSERALNWVRERNARSLAGLEADPRYTGIESDLRRIYLAKDRIPGVSLKGDWAYNFWQDETHVRGIWRRATLAEYKKPEPRWETVLDLDELARRENENWVWHGANCLPPEEERCLITLSRGGRDASVVREFDVRTKSFVEGGFALPEAKSSVGWMDRDTLWVGTDFGSGSLTQSGYPRIVKLWRRGQPLASAETVFEGLDTDMAASGYTLFRPEGSIQILSRSPSFFEEETWVRSADGTKRKVEVPLDASFSGVFKGQLFFKLRTDWAPASSRRFEAGSIIALDATTLDVSRAELVAAQDSRSSLVGLGLTRNTILLTTLENVNGVIYEMSRSSAGVWSKRRVALPDHGTVGLSSYSAFDDRVIVSYESFLTPSTLQFSDLSRPSRSFEVLKRAPARFTSRGMKVDQFFVNSRDGERIPYFVIKKQGLRMNGKNPTLLYGYGGFEISMKPSYLGATGKVWLEQGGVYVVANIRGGGEFGPRWHNAALKENRQKAYDDFIAVAEDLIRRRITSPAHLGIQGGSNGGLLMGAMLTQRPELFNAVVCEVPLLDMLRYTQLLAGASWIGEYGDPADPAMREVILRYSPYQNLRADRRYPKVFFMTSTADDRVHPGHARKMAARMEEMGHPYLYFENIEGGHGAAANLEQQVKRRTLSYTYLFQQLSAGTRGR